MSKKKNLLKLLAVLVLGMLAAGCASAEGPAGPVGPAGPAGPQGPAGPPGQDANVFRTYVGSEKCGACHETQYSKFVLSGHPYKLVKIENGQPPKFPYDAVTGGVKNPPEGYTWDDITYVIGGYNWKTRFVGKDGYIITNPPGETGVTDYLNQYNFANEDVGTRAGWASYHAGEEKVPYNCGACHTTGFNPAGHQDDLEGIVGTWAFPGVQCEACHGPGSQHVQNPSGWAMEIDRTSQACGACHYRGVEAQIDAKDGFAQHHEQYEELYNSKHFALSCITCHDPHASSVNSDPNANPNAGIQQVCETCHWQEAAYQKNSRHFSLQCTSCHMAPTGVSAVGNLETFTGDIRSHLFSINPDPNAMQFTEDGKYENPYLTLQYACMQCHNGQFATPQTLDVLAAMAKGYHTLPEPTPTPLPEPEPTATP